MKKRNSHDRDIIIADKKQAVKMYEEIKKKLKMGKKYTQLF